LYARLKFENKGWGATRGAMVVFNNRPKAGKGPNTKLSAEWLEFIRSINTEAGFRFILSPNSGWVNTVTQKNIFAENVSTGGNVVQVAGREGKFTHVIPLHVDQLPFARAIADFPDSETKCFIHRFTCLDRRNNVLNPAANVPAYYPFITNGPAWIETKRLDFFEEVPEPIWPADIAPPSEQRVSVTKLISIIRQGPDRDSSKVRVVGYGATFETFGAAYGKESWWKLSQGYIPQNETKVV
jgi:hypothetical protein